MTFQTERGVRIKVDRDYRAADTKASFRTQEKNLCTIVSKSNMNTLYTNNLLEQNIRHQQTKCFSQLTNDVETSNSEPSLCGRPHSKGKA